MGARVRARLFRRDARQYRASGKNTQPIGAGEGNRTLVCSLGSCRSTIELRPPMRFFSMSRAPREAHHAGPLKKAACNEAAELGSDVMERCQKIPRIVGAHELTFVPVPISRAASGRNRDYAAA